LTTGTNITSSCVLCPTARKSLTGLRPPKRPFVKLTTVDQFDLERARWCRFDHAPRPMATVAVGVLAPCDLLGAMAPLAWLNVEPRRACAALVHKAMVRSLMNDAVICFGQRTAKCWRSGTV
jgi:hypothetical protein